MFFFENLRRALSIFDGLRSRYGQRAFLVYHTASRACDRRLTPWRVPRPASVPHSSPLPLCTMRGQTQRPLIVRQVSSPAASSGCSLPGRRSPRSPVREGQRRRRPAHTSAVASPTAQRGMVFAPSASRRQRSPGKTPCVAGGEKKRAPSSQREIPMATPLRHTTSGPKEAHFPWWSVRVYCHWSPRTCRWRRPRSVRPIHPGPLAVVRCRSECLSEAHTHARHACHD
jgi:hypothetical protein